MKVVGSMLSGGADVTKAKKVHVTGDGRACVDSKVEASFAYSRRESRDR